MNDFVEVFRTERLIVRRWLDSDLEMILKVYSDKEIVKFVGDGTPITPELADKWLVVTKNNYEKRGYGMFTVLDLNKNILGFGGLVHPDNSELPEVKYAFLKDHWGKGYATEFVRHLLAYGLEKLKLKTIIATTHPENAASNYILEKCGFVNEKTLTNEDGSKTTLWRNRNHLGD